MMAATTKTMPMPNMAGKKCNLPAGGARAQNVVSKGGLPTRPSGMNANVGKK